MPPNGNDPKGPYSRKSLELVSSAALQFIFAGAIEVGLIERLALLGIDYREIVDGCMDHPSYKPIYH